MTDFDILARLRKLEAEHGRLKDRLAELERLVFPAPEYDASDEISDEEAYGAMVYTMRRQEQ